MFFEIGCTNWGVPFKVNLDIPTRETLETWIVAERIVIETEIKAYNVENTFEELKKDNAV